MYGRAGWGTRVNSSKSKWPHGRRSQEVPMPPALAAFFFSFDFDFIFIFILSSSLSFVVPFALSLSFNYGMHTTAISIRFCFVLHRTHKHTHTTVISALFSSPLLIYITNCARIKLHATRCDASQRIAFCVYRSFFAFVFTVWIGNEIGLKQQQSESKTKLVFICIHTFRTYIYNTIQERISCACVCVQITTAVCCLFWSFVFILRLAS